MTIKEIKKDWLLGASSKYSDKELVEGYKAVNSFLKKDFIDTKWKGQRGIAVVNQIVELGLNLIAVSGVKGFGLVQKRLLNSKTYDIASSELSNAVPFAAAGLLVELYPPHPEKSGELEMKIQTQKGNPVFVEVVSPRTQVWNRFLMKLVDPIKKIASQMEDIRLEIYLYKELDKDEQRELQEACRGVIKQRKVGIEKKDKNYHILLSHVNTIKINSAVKKTEEQTSLFVTNLTQTKGHKNIVTLGVPFADKRAQQVLEGEYHQLTSHYPNIVVIDVSGVPSGVQNWPVYIKRRLQPKLNRKISAVILSSSVNSKRIEREYILILNPYANNKIPKEIISVF